MTQRGATPYPQPPVVQKCPSGGRPGAEWERPGPTGPLQYTWYGCLTFPGVFETGIVAAALIRLGVQ